MTRLPVRARATVAALCVVLLPCAASATSFSITDASPTYSATDGWRQVTAYYPVLIDGSNANRLDAYFEAGFDAWNATNGVAEKWTLVDGGALSEDAKFELAIYDAYLSGASGGVEIRINYTPGPGDPAAATAPYADGMAVWAQAIYTDVKLGGGALPGNPYLDNPIASPDFDPPLYPYQYVGSYFYDKPARSMPPPDDLFWYAEAYLTQADYTNRTLTVYDGVAWGFAMQVPEPSTAALVMIGIGVLAARRRGEAPQAA